RKIVDRFALANGDRRTCTAPADLVFLLPRQRSRLDLRLTGRRVGDAGVDSGRSRRNRSKRRRWLAGLPDGLPLDTRHWRCGCGLDRSKISVGAGSATNQSVRTDRTINGTRIGAVERGRLIAAAGIRLAGAACDLRAATGGA